MIKTVCVFLALLAGFGFSSTSLAQTAPAAPQSVNQEQDVEVLLKTMNEVLEENRKIRAQMASNEDSLQKMARENDLLRSQVRRMKKEYEDAGGKDKDRAEALEKNVKEMEGKLASLVEENQKLADTKTFHEQRIPELENETDRLKKMLDSAILEEERVDYLNLIENAQEMADRSFEELKTTKKKMEVLNRDFGDAYYKLGNMLFDMKDFENAVISYRKALEAYPADPWVHHNLGIIYDYYIHDDKQALYHYRQYLQHQPLEQEALKIRERVLDIELKKNMMPEQPLKKDFFEAYTKSPR